MTLDVPRSIRRDFDHSDSSRSRTADHGRHELRAMLDPNVVRACRRADGGEVEPVWGCEQPFVLGKLSLRKEVEE